MEMDSPDRRLLPPRWLCWATLGAVFTIMLGWTWGGWPDPIVDFGRELYVPWQLAQGKVLYRDIAYFNGPLSPYFNALIFKLFGPSLHALEATNLVLLAGLSAMLFVLLERAFDRLTALVGGIVQLTIFSFIQLAGIGNYNFVTPYSHELTHGLILSVALLLKLLSSSPCTRGEGGGEGLRIPSAPEMQEPGGPSPQPAPRVQGKGGMILAGLLLGLIFLTKIEVFAAAAGATILAMLLAKRSLAAWAKLLAAASVPPLVALMLLHQAMPIADARHGVLGSWVYAFDPQINGNAFYRSVLGADLPMSRLLHALAMFAIDGAILFLLVLLGTVSHPHARRAALVGGWLVAVLAYFAIDPQGWQTAFAGLPLLLAMIGFFQIRSYWRARAATDLAAATFTLFSLLLLAKMVLNVRFTQYGFALALPAALAIVGFAIHTLPRRFSGGADGHAFLVQMTLPLIALVIAVHLRPYALIFSTKPIVVAAGADRFAAGDLRGVAVNQCLAQLAKLPPSATVAVVPEGVMINFLSRRENPTKYTNLMPPEIIMFGELNILADFQAHPPDYILRNERSDPAEYGFTAFADYAGSLSAWIAGHYESTNEPTIRPYPLRLLKRREALP